MPWKGYHMFLSWLILHSFAGIFFSLFAVSGYAGTLETIRQQFEIYHRFPGEIEILATENTKEIDGVLNRTEAKRLTVRRELDKALIDRKPNKNLPSPLFAEEYIIPFIHYVSVERAFAQRTLEQGRPEETLNAIQYVYRLADELSESGSLELRTLAARIRLQMLEIAQSLLYHPLCRREHHEGLYKIFENQINRRTTDAVIWTRYREEGKQFFAGIGQHGLSKMVSPCLREELMSRDAFREYEKAMALRTVHDQSVFHRVSGAIIESCSVPFFQRQPVLRQLEQELRTQRGTAAEPVFALLLLRDVSRTMQLFAQERSGIELAYLALSASLGNQSRSKRLNFLTGNEYEIRLITDGVLCTYEGNIKPFYVPYR